MEIGFIGTGVMGASIIKNMFKQDFKVNVYNRTKSKTDELVQLGATWYDTPKLVTQASDIIFTMVGFPKDVEEIYYGKQGIFEADVKGKILVDLTTSTPTLAVKIAETAQEQGAYALDAPVSGGDLGAKNGTLTIMVGGEKEIYEKVLPIFESFGKTFMLHGGAGKGQHTKMANQIMIAGTMTGMTEMLVYAQAAGLDLEKVIDTLGGGSAANWSMLNYGPRILREDYSAGFFVKHFIKDLKIALDESEKLSIKLPSTDLAKTLYNQLAEKGYENDGTQALIKLWWDSGKKPQKN
ncbi:2-hydroxy-3-oxopropionate reductase [Enterococcus phoeniculicola]|jgi:3-hydroxyisobutyrate dehydrogenase|uniref:2-hydroxy-3-oxopropionate reductase n=1 Tax=Enterococcus phoeniculicola ATCC BAA-412 TaxID=1158610 RepID=R3U146_9ENTE|nr:NAD(P)-dependent oxidoreductase [Enterococcus phoeniculicola]EOL47569.1 2-hydroxy-3-oxopropionate reductase [Enterococcus phoeniculicola ATCC BAA-412]EOT72864.1 2-hydroxy-3-oxopropionate reductase [Enterococcus phoeniculicola ATCC BAA-412]OJG71356.1 2-hydroxy-3-oxopropionate reductase [Enterococcus phoeniculicola]